MSRASFAFLVVGACAVTPWVSGQDRKAPPSNTVCVYTKPPVPAFNPPGMKAGEPGGGFYFGTPKLWAFLYFSPVGTGEKIAWFVPEDPSVDHTQRPPLSITLKRLDASAPEVGTDGNASWSSIPNLWPWFIGSGVNFPSRGCWEIAGRLNGETLRFVYLVQ